MRFVPPRDAILNDLSCSPHPTPASTATVYQATIVPWLWLLTHTTPTAAFSRSDPPDIAKSNPE